MAIVKQAGINHLQNSYVGGVVSYAWGAVPGISGLFTANVEVLQVVLAYP